MFLISTILQTAWENVLLLQFATLYSVQISILRAQVPTLKYSDKRKEINYVSTQNIGCGSRFQVRGGEMALKDHATKNCQVSIYQLVAVQL
jgi:hypothetical protein